MRSGHRAGADREGDACDVSVGINCTATEILDASAASVALMPER